MHEGRGGKLVKVTTTTLKPTRASVAVAAVFGSATQIEYEKRVGLKRGEKFATGYERRRVKAT